MYMNPSLKKCDKENTPKNCSINKRIPVNSKSSSKLNPYRTGVSMNIKRNKSQVMSSPSMACDLNKSLIENSHQSSIDSRYQQTPRISVELKSTTPSSATKPLRNQQFRISAERTFKGTSVFHSASKSVSGGTKSAGNTPKSLTLNYQRSLSSKKSSSRSLLASACKNSATTSSCNNTPLRGGQLNIDFTNITPTNHLDPSIYKKLNMPHISDGNESTTVSVGVRVRPLNERELLSPNIRNIVQMEGNEVFIHCENDSVAKFSFDHCLWSVDSRHPNYASQVDVYETVARPLLEHAYEGYNVSLFAYGQTGSGKSYSIMGEGCNFICENGAGFSSENIGILPRFCRELFDKATEVQTNKIDQGVTCRVTVEISYIEIYNEKIFDLIGCPLTTAVEGREDESASAGVDEKREPLRIREHPTHGPYIVGASCPVVTSYEDLQTWLMLGNKQRSVAATGMNDKSSRSHSVFTIRLSQTQQEVIAGEDLEHTKMSTINLVDLAGSERVAISCSEGDRLKEGICINMSLLTLGKVIMALAECDEKRKTFIPYRESTLTFLLKESLGGNSKTSMIATISPSNIHQEETLSTLRYAQHARKIVNWNHVNEDKSYLQIIKALQEEVERLHSMKLSPKSSKSLFGDELKEGSAEAGAAESDAPDYERTKLDERLVIEEKEREIDALKQKLRSTEELFNVHTRQLESKVAESEKLKEDALKACKLSGLVLQAEDNQPTLVNLCEDQQFTESLLYNLKQGCTSFGSRNADITLSGLPCAGIYCSVLFENGKLCLYPNANCETYLNGELVQDKIQIHHNDRLVFGGQYFFRVAFPESPSSKSNETKKFNFHHAKEELLKIQEQKIRDELRAQHECLREEILREVEEKRLEMKLHEKSMRENLDFLADELEEERNLKYETEKEIDVLKCENKFLEGKLKSLQLRNPLSSSILDVSIATPSPIYSDNFFKEVEVMFEETIRNAREAEIHAETDPDLRFSITKANHLCEKLSKPFKFDQKSVLGKLKFETKLFVHDLNHDLFAHLTSAQFADILVVLEDINLGMRSEESLPFETNLKWERSEDFSKVCFSPSGGGSALRGSLANLSILNASFLNSSLVGSGAADRRSSFGLSSRPPTNRKRLSIESVTSNPPFETANTTTSSAVLVAKALSSALLNASSNRQELPTFIDALSRVNSFYSLLQTIKVTCPNTSQSDDANGEFSSTLVHFVLASQSLDICLRNISSLQLTENVSEKGAEVQTSLLSCARNLVKAVIRILQGVENDVKSILEEEMLNIEKMVAELSSDLAFLNAVARAHLPRGSDLSLCGVVRENYLKGLSSSLEWMVSRVAESAAGASQSLQRYVNDYQLSVGNRLFKYALPAIDCLADFMKSFCLLKVIPDTYENLPAAAVKKESNRFICRVSRASENVRHIWTSLTNLVREIKNVACGSVNFDELNEATQNLQESLGELVDDAGIGASFKKSSVSSVESTTTEDSVEIFLEELHHSAMKTFQHMITLKRAIYHSEKATTSTLDLSCSFTQIPDPNLKSALRHSQHGVDEKKVRFNVTLSPSVTESPSNDIS